MARNMLLSRFLNKIKPQYLGVGYHPLDDNEYQEFMEIFSSCNNSRRTSYASVQSSAEQQYDIARINDTFEPEVSINHGSVKRIVSQNSAENLEIVYEIHDGFTPGQISVIESALQVVIDRIFKPEIVRNMYQICGASGNLFSDDLLSQSNLEQTKIYLNPHLLLHYQFMCLKTKSANGEFPIINIYPVHEDHQNDSRTNNSSLCVFCISHGTTFLIDGEFEIELNQDKLNGTVRNMSNAIYWAGEIVDSMLRNLGHQSQKLGKKASSQIQVFKKCFLHDGNYIPVKSK